MPRPLSPAPDATLRISIAVGRVARDLRGDRSGARTPGRVRSVSTMAPIIATSSTRPATWK